MRPWNERNALITLYLPCPAQRRASFRAASFASAPELQKNTCPRPLCCPPLYCPPLRRSLLCCSPQFCSLLCCPPWCSPTLCCPPQFWPPLCCPPVINRSKVRATSPLCSVANRLETCCSLRACADTASATAGWLWPRLTTASPERKSKYSLPCRSHRRHPSPFTNITGGAP